MKPYYEEENIQIYNSDCLEVLPGLEKVDLCLTDPPYNASNSNIGFKNGYKTIDEKWDKNFNPYPFLNVAFQKIREGGSILTFCSYHLLGKYLEYNKKIQQVLHWEYVTAMPAIAKVYTPVIEYIVWYSTPKYTFNKKEAETNVLRVRKAYQVDYKMEHPSVKPSNLIKKLLRVHSNPNNLIIDPFLGSGTTAVACKELGRRCIGIEISETYCQIAVKRLKNTQKDMFL